MTDLRIEPIKLHAKFGENRSSGLGGVWRQTDRRTEGQKDRQTDRRTDGHQGPKLPLGNPTPTICYANLIIIIIIIK